MHRTSIPFYFVLAAGIAAALPSLAQSIPMPTPKPTPPETSAPAQAQGDRQQRLVERVDTDHDGAVSLAEAQAFAAGRFERLDRARKGFLTLDDFAGSLRRAAERAAPDRKPGLERALAAREAEFRRMDRDGDGKVTREEYLADSRALFAAADKDGNGKLVADEIRAARGRAF